MEPEQLRELRMLVHSYGMARVKAHDLGMETQAIANERLDAAADALDERLSQLVRRLDILEAEAAATDERATMANQAVWMVARLVPAVQYDRLSTLGMALTQAWLDWNTVAFEGRPVEPVLPHVVKGLAERRLAALADVQRTVVEDFPELVVARRDQDGVAPWDAMRRAFSSATRLVPSVPGDVYIGPPLGPGERISGSWIVNEQGVPLRHVSAIPTETTGPPPWSSNPDIGEKA